MRLKVDCLRLKPPEALPAEAGLRLRGRCDLKALRILAPLLIFDVRLDRLLIHRAHRRAKISSRPQVLPPIPLAQVWKFLLQPPARPTLQILHQFRWRQLRRCRHQQMNMIRRHCSPHNRYFSRCAYLPDRIARPLRHFPAQHLIPILRNPLYVLLHVPNRVRAPSVLHHHTPNLARTLKAYSLKGGGFRPGSWN